jgi:Mg-chelatase subunit ChlD
VGVVGFRDRGDDWTTKATDFTNNRTQAQVNLWKLRADGGGDEPELVYDALKIAFTQFSWRPKDAAQQVLVLVGDAPPHPGFGAASVDLAKAGKQIGITTFVISARNPTREEAKHFPEIARAGGGRVIRLTDRTDLAAELAGVALADTWHDPIVALFERYLLLCR